MATRTVGWRATCVAVGLVGCAASGPERTSGPSDPGPGEVASAASLVEKCSGRYTCTADDGETFSATFEMEDGVCYSGDLEFGADGSVEAPTDPEWIAGDVHWSGDAITFQVCSDTTALCVTCADPNGGAEPATPTPTEEESAGRCEGSAPSCYSVAYGSCAYVDGCYGRSHLRWNGSYEYYCDGVSRSCHTYYYESSCNGQRGCHWVE